MRILRVSSPHSWHWTTARTVVIVVMVLRYKNDCFAIQTPKERYQRKVPLLSFFLAVTFHWNSCNVFCNSSWHLLTTPDLLLPSASLCCRGHQKYETKPDLHFVWRYDRKDSLIKAFLEDPTSIKQRHQTDHQTYVIDNTYMFDFLFTDLCQIIWLSEGHLLHLPFRFVPH